MASRFEPVTDADLAWEYRKAGLLYYWRGDWFITADVPKWEHFSRFIGGVSQYAVLVEED